MNKIIGKPLHIAKMYVKALTLEKSDLVIGLLDWSHITEEYTVRDHKLLKNFCVDPYSICRNSGITDKNGRYIYEYDLLLLTHGIKSSCYGFLVWDEFYKSWKIRRRTDMTSYCNLDDWTVEAIGNIVLSETDAEVILKQEREQDALPSFIDNSYCPSKFRK